MKCNALTPYLFNASKPNKDLVRLKLLFDRVNSSITATFGNRVIYWTAGGLRRVTKR